RGTRRPADRARRTTLREVQAAARVVIRIESLTVQFGGVRPLDALEGEFRAPICGLIGPNGAGKTTLLNVLSGFVRPVKGTTWLDGTALTGLSPARRTALGLRRTFQQELVEGPAQAQR